MTRTGAFFFSIAKTCPKNVDDSELIDNHLHPQGKCDAVASLETLALHVIKLRISLLCAGGGISVLTKKTMPIKGGAYKLGSVGGIVLVNVEKLFRRKY